MSDLKTEFSSAGIEPERSQIDRTAALHTVCEHCFVRLRPLF